MFKKLYFKFFIWCISASVLIIIVSAALSSFGITSFLFNRFIKDVNSVAESAETSLVNYYNSAEPNSSVDEIISIYDGYLGIDENRSVYILSSADLSVVYPKNFSGEAIVMTENLKLAMEDKKGDKLCYNTECIDYAYKLKNNGIPLIFYVRDTGAEIRAAIVNNLYNFIFIMIIAVLISILLAFVLSSKITKPIKKITKRAEGFEKGELIESFEDIKGEELGELLSAVNKMGFVMAGSIRKMNSDKHKVEVILEHINNGIMTFDSQQNMIQINSAAKRILKIKDDENIKFDKFFINLGVDVCMAEFSYLGKSKTVEKEIKNENLYIKVWFIPFKMDEERNAGVVCVFEDITEQFNVMQAMRKFVADVSHELKTPITVISSYTETVLSGYLDDKAMASNLLNIVYQEAGKMTELVQNLLDISKYEMKAIERSNEPFSVDEMLLSLVNTFKMEAEKKELDLTYNRMSELPLFKGSRNDMERAVKNIISNSIKYTSRGDKIRIFAGKLHNEMYIKIEDTGWGIPENKLGHLFERFYRVEDEARSRDKGGTGLGLSIAKEIIESHNGSIKIESEYTKYTRVTITLPVSNGE